MSLFLDKKVIKVIKWEILNIWPEPQLLIKGKMGIGNYYCLLCDKMLKGGEKVRIAMCKPSNRIICEGCGAPAFDKLQLLKPGESVQLEL